MGKDRRFVVSVMGPTAMILRVGPAIEGWSAGPRPVDTQGAVCEVSRDEREPRGP